MFTEKAAPNETPTGSAAINAQLLLRKATPAASAVGLGARGLTDLIEAALKAAGYQVLRHSAGYRLIVMERGRP